MKLDKILVVYKKSAYRVYAEERKDKKFLRLMKDRHHLAKRFKDSHKAHVEALARVREILKKRGIQAKFVYRAQAFSDRGYDLVMSVGGDGTFLEASHSVTTQPILGLNSNPPSSVGIFCGTTVDQLEDTLTRIEEDRCPSVPMLRLSICLQGDVLPVAALNDILIANENPSATTRYIIRFKGREEEHKSSGIWIAPPAGSTAAIRGAGGKYMSIRSHMFQFKVRELYREPGTTFHLVGGVVRPREKLSIISKSRSGRLFVDGSHVVFPFSMGDRVEILPHPRPLRVFKFDEERRGRLWG